MVSLTTVKKKEGDVFLCETINILLLVFLSYRMKNEPMKYLLVIPFSQDTSLYNACLLKINNELHFNFGDIYDILDCNCNFLKQKNYMYTYMYIHCICAYLASFKALVNRTII